MDTTSNALSRILHLLAQHPDVQEKLRQELLDAGAADGLAYEELNRLPFLDSVCRETLRVYVPLLASGTIPKEHADLMSRIQLSSGSIVAPSVSPSGPGMFGIR